jgi:predicted nucleic-acid-binding Zn-ribbon protein
MAQPRPTYIKFWMVSDSVWNFIFPLIKKHNDKGINPPENRVLALQFTPTQGGDQLKTGICPKCTSTEVFSGAGIALKKGPFGSNAIPIGLTSIAALDNYVCTSCGYVESYISDLGKLTEISRKWDNAGQEDSEEKEDE